MPFDALLTGFSLVSPEPRRQVGLEVLVFSIRFSVSASLLALTLAGCASLPADWGRPEVAKLTADRGRAIPQPSDIATFNRELLEKPLTATAAGRRAAAAWLDTPVSHVRDVRVELLLKLLLRERAGLPVAPLAAAQLVALPFDRLLDAESDDLVDLWRKEHARSVLAFLQEVAGRETSR